MLLTLLGKCWVWGLHQNVFLFQILKFRLNPIAFSISLFINSLEVKDHVCQLGEVFPRYASREFVGKTGNQISPDQKSDFNKSKFRTRHWCHMCCGMPAGGIPWIALAAFLLDPEARQTDSTPCKKLAHRPISCIKSPASAAEKIRSQEQRRFNASSTKLWQKPGLSPQGQDFWS